MLHCFLGTAIIANADERYKGEIIKLWPKDVASKDTKGLGTMKPGRKGGLRLTDITQPYLTYFPALTENAWAVIIISPGGGYTHIGSAEGRYKFANGSMIMESPPLSCITDYPRIVNAYKDIQRAVGLSAHELLSGTSTQSG